MQYQDGHISTCFNKKILVIYLYCTYACASYSLSVIYLFVLSYLLLIVHLFSSLFDCLFCFHSHLILCYLLFKEKRTILILYHVQVFRSCYRATCSSTRCCT
jgi:hypothetical protein